MKGKEQITHQNKKKKERKEWESCNVINKKLIIWKRRKKMKKKYKEKSEERESTNIFKFIHQNKRNLIKNDLSMDSANYNNTSYHWCEYILKTS